IPVEISVAAVGYQTILNNVPVYTYGYPPQPPMILRHISVCNQQEVLLITEQPGFLRVLLHNREIPADELIPITLLRAARLRPPATRADFLLASGQFLARYMGQEPLRLEQILRVLHVAYQELAGFASVPDET
ncbi:MAG: hypothetical protein P1S60_15350, partial [Anaerolineae bacterium]|nr:hypothetical protein [Anaerolineae bacterium]